MPIRKRQYTKKEKREAKITFHIKKMFAVRGSSSEQCSFVFCFFAVFFHSFCFLIEIHSFACARLFHRQNKAALYCALICATCNSFNFTHAYIWTSCVDGWKRPKMRVRMQKEQTNEKQKKYGGKNTNKKMCINCCWRFFYLSSIIAPCAPCIYCIWHIAYCIVLA